MIQSPVYHRSSIMINDVQSLSSAFGFGHSEWSGYEDGQFYKTPRGKNPQQLCYYKYITSHGVIVESTDITR
jgi:hypothetical protein